MSRFDSARISQELAHERLLREHLDLRDETLRLMNEGWKPGELRDLRLKLQRHRAEVRQHRQARARRP